MVRLRIAFFTILCWFLLVPSYAAHADLMVDATVTPLGGSFLYEFSITNTNPEDAILVSIVDAPLDDPLIDPSLMSPIGFDAFYDPGVGAVDFLEDTNLFATGTTTGGFRFESLSGPGPGVFTSFEAFNVNLDLIVGNVQTTVIPEPATFGLWTLLATVGIVGHRARSWHLSARQT